MPASAAAKNDIVVLLNSDMRVASGISSTRCSKASPTIRSSPCRARSSSAIPAKLREETGLTQGWWEDGDLRVRHRIRSTRSQDLFPCFYGGGGSCAFDRQKFLELGGFDRCSRRSTWKTPTLGFLAWKRGWKVLYQPRSIVYHEHRGTIGKRFTASADPGRSSRRTSCCSVGRTSTSGEALARISPLRLGGVVFSGALRRCSRTRQRCWPSGAPSANCRRRSAFALPRTATRGDIRYRSFPPTARRLFSRSLLKLSIPSAIFVCSLSRPIPSARPSMAAGSLCTRPARELARNTELHLIVLLDYAPRTRGSQTHREVVRQRGIHRAHGGPPKNARFD